MKHPELLLLLGIYSCEIIKRLFGEDEDENGDEARYYEPTTFDLNKFHEATVDARKIELFTKLLAEMPGLIILLIMYSAEMGKRVFDLGKNEEKSTEETNESEDK